MIYRHLPNWVVDHIYRRDMVRVGRDIRMSHWIAGIRILGRRVLYTL